MGVVALGFVIPVVVASKIVGLSRERERDRKEDKKIIIKNNKEIIFK